MSTTPRVLPGLSNSTERRGAARRTAWWNVLNPDANVRQTRISAEQAMLFIGSLRERLSVVALSGDECADALQAAAALGIVGGGIYDAMLAHAAINARVKAIYRWNTREYALCGPEVIRLLQTP